VGCGGIGFASVNSRRMDSHLAPVWLLCKSVARGELRLRETRFFADGMNIDIIWNEDHT
jgi:hypothetical protein